MPYCRECGEYTTRKKYCSECSDDNDDSGDFLLSVGVGAVTDSAIIGGLVGGSLLGGTLGDASDGDLWD